jgi:predicted metal-dependent phosphoesterase TrpH
VETDLKIDLHVHTSERSDCGRSSESEMIDAAKAAGLDAIVLADHYRLPPPVHLEELNARHAPFRIFPGIEVRADGEDIVVVGLECNELESREWAYPDLWRFVEDRRGFFFVAHPFRYSDEVGIDVENFPPGAVEMNSCNMGAIDEALLQAFLARYNLPTVCNSDAHRDAYVGIYHNVLEHPARDSAQLVDILKNGRFTCASLDDRIEQLKIQGEKPLR